MRLHLDDVRFYRSQRRADDCQLLANCGYNSRNVTIASLALSIGIGFTQTPAIFKIFPNLIKNVFAENCVAVVFIVAMVLNIILPKEEEE